MAGLGAALGAGISGGQQAMDWQMRRQQQQNAMARDHVQNQREDELYAQQQADRAEFDVPERRARMGDAKEARRRQKMLADLGIAYQKRDLEAVRRIYDDGVPDGHTAKLNWTPDGQVEIQHSSGQTVVAPFEDVIWGKEDGSGLGLIDMLQPEGVPAKRAGVAERKAKRADTAAEYELRGGLVDREHRGRMQEIGAQGAQSRDLEMLRGASTFTGDDGTLQQYRPDGSVRAVMGSGGAPVQAPKMGMAGAGGRGGRDTRTALQKNYEYRASIAIRSNPALADMDPGEVAGMLMALDEAGKDRALRMKIAASLAAKAYGEYDTQEQNNARARALFEGVEDLAGPAPQMRMPGGGDEQPAAPRAGDEMDGYIFRGGDPSDPNNWEPIR